MKKCLYCNTITDNLKFCSRRCVALFNNYNNHFRRGKSIYDGKIKIGQQYGKWTIINDLFLKLDKNSTSRRAHIIAQCECGMIKEMAVRVLLRGKQLGCFKCSRAGLKEKNHNWKGIGDLSGVEYTRIKRNAKIRNYEFSISKEKLWRLYILQDKKCALTDLPISLKEIKTASLDRIDNNKGYTLDNVQWVHKDVNIMKNQYNQNYFIEICNRIVNQN